MHLRTTLFTNISLIMSCNIIRKNIKQLFNVQRNNILAF